MVILRATRLRTSVLSHYSEKCIAAACSISRTLHSRSSAVFVAPRLAITRWTNRTGGRNERLGAQVRYLSSETTATSSTTAPDALAAPIEKPRPVRIAIVGRPNVGKSTLFNRLAGRRVALTNNTPGLTRDRKESLGEINRVSIRIIDTAGLEPQRIAVKDPLLGKMMHQTDTAIEQADVVLFMIDAREGITPPEMEFARTLVRDKAAATAAYSRDNMVEGEVRRNRLPPVLLVANKTEGGFQGSWVGDAYALGMGVPVSISAEHGHGMDDLFEKILSFVPKEVIEAHRKTYEEEEKKHVIQFAIVGRPNVGKSTLVNALLGEDRVIVHDEAGTTRDTVAVEWSFKDTRVRLVDTAGVRQTASFRSEIEKLSIRETLKALDFAHVAAVVIDAMQGFTRQDLNIARMCADEGRGVVLVVNKWDLVAEEWKERARESMTKQAEGSLAQLRGAPLVFISAKERLRTDRIMPHVITVYDRWNTRVSTGELNSWFEQFSKEHPPPSYGGRMLKVRYMTQSSTRPPTFLLYVNNTELVTQHYLRKITRGLREEFSFGGVPIRIYPRDRKSEL